MYVPAMKGQKARELGSPDFRHPSRTVDDFDEHIDDFPLVSILLSLKTISINPALFKQYGATDRLLLSERDYRDIANSTVLRSVLTQISNTDLSRIYSLFIITLSENGISEDTRKFIIKEECKSELYNIYRRQSQCDRESKFCLSCLLMNGFGCKQDTRDAIKLITELAEQGYARAQFKLGRYYQIGNGVAQNYEKSILWYTKAAEQGDARAQTNLGILYGRGLGTTQNYEKAIEWESKAANQGIALAQGILGYCYEGKGIKHNYEKALEWYTKAAEQGEAISQNRLGELYEEGNGVPQNYEKAVEWYTKAAEKGNKYSQYHLANCYRFGRGVSVNQNESIRLFRLAADQGLEIAWNEIIKTREGWRFRATYSEDGDTFEGIYAGTEYEIKEGTKYISEGACFDMNWEIDCSYFSKLTIPKSIINIGDCPFGSHMSDVVCYSPFYEVDNKTLYTKGKSELIQCFNHKVKEFEIPKGVTTIRKYAFYSCQFKRIVIPSSVKEIGKNPFVGAGILDDNMHYNLEIVSNSPSCLVNKNTLYNNNKLISYWGNDDFFVVPYGVQIIEDNAFRWSNIKKIFLPNSIKSIGKDAFCWCIQLKKIIISYGELQRFKMILPSTMHNMLCEEMPQRQDNYTINNINDIPF
jgi:hypothetical protein